MSQPSTHNCWPAREARPGSAGWQLFKTLIQTVLFWSFFLGLIPWGISLLEFDLGLEKYRLDHWLSPLAVQTMFGLGVGLFAVAGMVGLSSGILMAIVGQGTPLPCDCPRRLVVIGPYRYVRNPMAIAGLAQGVAVGLMVGSIPIVIYSICGAPVWNRWVRPWEEHDLSLRFGEPYQEYCREVKCWWPRFTPWTPTSPKNSEL